MSALFSLSTFSRETDKMAVRLFKRLEFTQGLRPHPFFLERMAYLQMQNNGDFTSGPMITAEPAPQEYSYWTTLDEIEHGMRYFMRPYELVAFGHNEADTTKSHLLTRAWMHHINGANRVTVTVERINQVDLYPYMNQINNKPIWCTDSWNTNAKSLTQTLKQTNHPYNGCWGTFLELQ